MKFNEVADVALGLWKDAWEAERPPDIPICLLGQPGIGKSAVARQAARRMTALVKSQSPGAADAVCVVLDLSSLLPEDIGGIPVPEKRGDLQVAIYAIQEWMAACCEEGAYGVLCLDDLPAAAPAVQVAARQLVLDRKVGSAKLSDGIFIFVTGNRRADKSGASTLPAHFRNCVMMLQLETDVVSWAKWYGQQEGASPLVASFLRWKNSAHSQSPADADEHGAFATPRSWERVGRIYETGKRLDQLFSMTAGLVGLGMATEFTAFVELRAGLVDPKAVLADPEGALPHPRKTLDTAGKAYALTTGLAEVSARRFKAASSGTEARKVVKDFVFASAWATEGNRDYAGASIYTFVDNGGDLGQLLLVLKQNEKNPSLNAYIEFFKKLHKGA